MLQIATDTSVSVPDHIRQNAAVQLKNTLRRARNPHEFAVSPDDDAFLAQSLFLFMVKAGLKQVYVQLQECLALFAEHKLPNNWPTIFEQVTGVLTSASEPKAVYAALTATYCMSKLYIFELGEKRKGFDVVVSKVFGLLYEVAAKLLATPGEEAAGFLKLIVKSLACNVRIDISELLIKENVFAKWMRVLQEAFEWPVNPELETPTEDEEVIKQRKKSEMLKLRKAIVRVFYDIFRKYGEPRLAPEVYREFSIMIQRDYASGIIKLNLQIVQSSNTKFIHPFILSIAFKALRETIRNKKFQGEIRGGLDEILQIYAFPKLQISPKDAKLWDDDPQEFIKLVLEEEMWDNDEPRFAAMQLIESACSEDSYYNKDKDLCHPVLAQFLSFLASVLHTSIQHGQVRMFDAALFTVGMLEEEVERYEALVANIEPVLKQCVLPNLRNPLGIVRMRCAWVYSKFAAVEFKDLGSLSEAFRELIKMLKEKELPVKFMAMLAVANLVNRKELAEQVRQHVAQIISVYLEQMKEMDSERLTDALNNIIKNFSQEIKPYAINLIKEILNVCYGTFEHPKGEEDLDAEAEMTAAACLDAVGTIIEVIGKSQAELQQAETLLLPVAVRSFSPDGSAVMDSAIGVLAKLSYYSLKSPSALWQLLPLFVDMTVGTAEDVAERENIREEGNWGYENLKELLPILQNLISRDPHTFLVSTTPQGSYTTLTFTLIARILHIAKCSGKDTNRIPAIRLAITLLEALKVDAV